MPDQEFFKNYIINSREKNNGIFYIGGINERRSIFQIIDALEIVKNKGIEFVFHCIGPISKTIKISISQKIKDKVLEKQIVLYDRLDLAEGFSISKKCRLGLSIMQPVPNFYESYSTKIFEYMAIKLPVITSNFPIYKDVVEKQKCGFCVDPNNIHKIATSIESLFIDNELTTRMGNNGYRAIKYYYNWGNEKKKLLNLYQRILNS